MSAQDSSTAFAKFSQSYTVLAGKLGHKNVSTLDINLGIVHSKLMQAVSNEITGVTSEIKTTAAEGFAHSKEVVVDFKALPDMIFREIEAMPELLGLERFKHIAARVRQLLNKLQEVVQNPSAMFPRLACSELPVDPALITSFRKRYLRLERMNQNDPEFEHEERSMPTAPKSALDVITNITSSLETFGDDVLASAEAIAKLSEELGKLRDLTQGLRSTEAVLEMLQKEEKIHDIISQVSSLFQAEENPTSNAVRTLDKQQSPNPLDLVKEASSMVENVKRISGELNATVAKIQNTSNLYSSFITDMKELFCVALQRLSRLIDTVQKLKANLPRIGRELRQFFMPTGFKALILKPSGTLLSIFHSLEDIRTGLSEPETVARSAINTVNESDASAKVEATKKKLDELQNVPRKLASIIEKQDLQKMIADTLERVVSEMMNDIGANVLQGAASGMLEAMGAGNLASEVGEHLGYLAGHTNSKKEEPLKNSLWRDGDVSLPWGAEKLFR